MSARKAMRRKAPPSTAHILADDFEGADKERATEDSGRNATDTNQLVITSASSKWAKQRAREEKAAEAAKTRPPPMSKAQRRKLEQIAARKQKAEARSHVLASLAQHSIDSDKLRLMGRSGALGQKETKRQKLQRAVHARKANVTLDGLVSLEVARGDGDGSGGESGGESGDSEGEGVDRQTVMNASCHADVKAASSTGHSVTDRSSNGACSHRSRNSNGEVGSQPTTMAPTAEQGGCLSVTSEAKMDWAGPASTAGSASAAARESESGEESEHDDAWWAQRAMGFGMAAQLLPSATVHPQGGIKHSLKASKGLKKRGLHLVDEQDSQNGGEGDSRREAISSARAGEREEKIATKDAGCNSSKAGDPTDARARAGTTKHGIATNEAVEDVDKLEGGDEGDGGGEDSREEGEGQSGEESGEEESEEGSGVESGEEESASDEEGESASDEEEESASDEEEEGSGSDASEDAAQSADRASAKSAGRGKARKKQRKGEADAKAASKPLSALAQAVLAMFAQAGEDGEQEHGTEGDGDGNAGQGIGADGAADHDASPAIELTTARVESDAGRVLGPASRSGAFYVPVHRTAEVQESRANLPIFSEEQRVMEAVAEQDVVLLCGATGSGKTTQLPQFLYEAGYGHPQAPAARRGLIGVTQPRRVAAVAMAQRVSHELNVSLGGQVGYQVRYDHSTVTDDCRIKFMTDGVLLREVSTDLLLSKYSVLILDEAHERGLNTDLLMGILSRVVRLRAQRAAAAGSDSVGGACDGTASAHSPGPLKLIIMSATLQVEQMQGNRLLFPSPPPVISVEARQFPVSIHFQRKTPEDHVEAAFKMASKIHSRLPEGGILIFLTGQREIDHLCEQLRQRYPTHARKPERLQPKRLAEKGQGAAAAGEAAAAEPEAVMRNEKARAAAAAAEAEVARLEQGGAGAESARTLGLLIGEEEEEQEVRPEGQAAAEDQLGLGATHLSGGAEESLREQEGEPAQASAACVAANTPLDALDPEMFDLNDDDGDDVDGDEGEVAVGAEDARRADEPRGDDELGGGPMLVLPLYSMLPASEQMRIFAPPPPGVRLVVVATNVAETSVTIPNISYVVDSGKHKQRSFGEHAAVSRYELEWISQASANQRAGRAGRVGPGHCYRLYSSSVYENVFPQFTEPEIRRVPVEGVVLQMKAMGIDNVETFPFPEPPPQQTIASAQHALRSIGALGPAPEHAATSLGVLLSKLPLSARLGKLLLLGRHAKMLRHALPLVAMLAQQDPFVAGANQPDSGQDGDGLGRAALLSDAGPPRWRCAESDAISLLGVYHQWLAAGGTEEAAISLKLVPKVMKEASQLCNQLSEILRVLFPQLSASELRIAPSPPSASESTALRRALSAALPERVARLASLCETPAERQLMLTLGEEVKPALLRRAYLSADEGYGQLLWLRPHSELAKLKPRPKYVAFFEIVVSKRPYLSRATAIEPSWLPEASPALTTLSPPVLDVPPKFDAASDQTLCWVQPTYGRAQWILPLVPRPLPNADADLYAGLFACALCDGQVLRALRPLASELSPRARTLCDPAAGVVDRAAVALRTQLLARKATSRSVLCALWLAEPRFLLKELAALLPTPRRRALLDLWPTMLAEAERRATKR